MSRAYRQSPALNSQAGFTLIEVMISVLILSIGLLGLAGLQAAALQTNQSAFTRSQATAFAYDLADRMRANIPGVAAGNYNPANASLTNTCTTTGGCSAQEMAEHDLAEWNALIATYLPMGQGTVCIDSTPEDGAGAAAAACDGSGSQYAIKIWWDDNKDGVITVSATDMERLVINFQL